LKKTSTPLNLIRLLTLFSIIIILFNCKTAGKKSLLGGKQPQTLVVLDFRAPNNPENEKYIKGWWFGSRDIYKNKNAGNIYADIFAEELEKSGLFKVYKRSELKYYMADLRKKLQKEYPALAEDVNKNKCDEIINNIDPVTIGKDLGIEKVLTGEIDNCYTAHSRAFHTWASKVSVTAKIIDVKTGKIDWEMKYKKKKAFYAPNVLSKRNVQRMIKNIKKNYPF